MNQSDAEIISARALEFLASDEELLARFLAISGMGPADIRQNIGQQAFLTGVLSFLLDHEPDAMAFCEFADLQPGQALQARAILGNEIPE